MNDDVNSFENNKNQTGLLNRLKEELKQAKEEEERIEQLLFSSVSGSNLVLRAALQLSNEWFEERKNKITASRFGVICEQSKFSTAYSYFEYYYKNKQSVSLKWQTKNGARISNLLLERKNSLEEDVR